MAANSTNNSGVCNSRIKTTKDTFIWNIDNFSIRNQEIGECLESGIFISYSPSGNPLKWKLRLYPKGENDKAKDHLSVYIHLVDSAVNEVWSKLSFSIRDSKGVDKIQSSIGNIKITKNEPRWGFPKFFQRIELLDDFFLSDSSGLGLLPNDQLTIICQVTVYGEETMECIQTVAPKFQIPECHVVEEMSHLLFDKSLLTDLVLVASSDGKEFKVHKGILAARSPVFAAIFKHEMTESKGGIVKIDDIESAVLEQTLRFIYGGTAPKLVDMAEELFEAADKYQLDRLKILCERQLANSIGNGNACKLLALAHRHSAENLKTHAIKFIKEHAKEVMASDGWKTLKANQMDLVDLIVMAFAESK